MSAICDSGPNCSDIITMPWPIIHAKFLNKLKKLYIQELAFDRSICMATIFYGGPIRTIRSKIVTLHWQKIHAKFREDIKYIDMPIKKAFNTRT